MSRVTLCLMVVGWVASAIDLYIPQLIHFRYKDISKQFVKTVDLECGSSMRDSTILYGNSHYGFFSIRPQIIADGKIRLEIIPPGYRYPIRFYAYHPQRGWRPFATRQFKSPVPAFFNSLQGTATKGRLSTVFLSLSATVGTYENLSNSQKNFELVTVTVVNRLGEVVWLHLPRISPTRPRVSQKELVAKPIGKGMLGVLVSQDHFETVDFKGRVHTRIRFDGNNGDDGLDHDFVQLPTGELLAIGSAYRIIRLPRSTVPMIKSEGPQGFARTFLLSRPRKMRFNTLVTFDPLSESSLQPVWRSIDALSPHQTRENLPATDYTNLGASFEFSHVNSLDYRVGEGFLLSLSAQNRLVFLDESLKLKWTVGSSPRDTYHFPTPYPGFRFQHSATRLPGGNILLMDNLGCFPSRSRIMELRLAPSGSIIAEKIFTPDLPLLAASRGAAYRLPNGNTLGYYPSPFLVEKSGSVWERPSSWHYLIEFDKTTLREVAAVKFLISAPVTQRKQNGYRAELLEAVGLESYVGDRVPG